MGAQHPGRGGPALLDHVPNLQVSISCSITWSRADGHISRSPLWPMCPNLHPVQAERSTRPEVEDRLASATNAAWPENAGPLSYFRCWARCLFISNMVTRFLPNTAWSFSSAMISRLFCGSWSLFFLM